MTRTNIPTRIENLKPAIINNVSTELLKLREKQKQYSDRHAKDMKNLEVGDKVRFQTAHRNWKGGKIKEKLENPRSVLIKTNEGNTYRRNTGIVHKTEADITEERDMVVTSPSNQSRIELDPSINNSNQETDAPSPSSPQDTSTEFYRTRSGRTVKPIKRLDL